MFFTGKNIQVTCSHWVEFPGCLSRNPQETSVRWANNWRLCVCECFGVGFVFFQLLSSLYWQDVLALECLNNPKPPNNQIRYITKYNRIFEHSLVLLCLFVLLAAPHRDDLWHQNRWWAAAWHIPPPPPPESGSSLQQTCPCWTETRMFTCSFPLVCISQLCNVIKILSFQ